MKYCKCGIFHLKFADLDDFVQAEKENQFSCAWCNRIIHHKTFEKLQSFQNKLEQSNEKEYKKIIRSIK